MNRIAVLIAAAAIASSASAQTPKDRNMSKIRRDRSAPAVSKYSVSRPSRSLSAPSVVTRPSGTGSIDKQLSAMQQRTQNIVGARAAAKKSAPVYVKPKPEPSGGGFDASPYVQKHKSMTVTNSSQARGALRSPAIHGRGR